MNNKKVTFLVAIILSFSHLYSISREEAETRQLIIETIQSRDYDNAKNLTNSGVNLNFLWQGKTPLEWAIESQAGRIVDLLKNKGAITTKNLPKIIADSIANKDKNTLEFWLNEGYSPVFNLSQLGLGDQSFLSYAVSIGNEESVALLMPYFSDQTIRNNALVQAVLHNKPTIAKLLLAKEYSNPYVTYQGQTLNTIAVEKGYAEVLSELLDVELKTLDKLKWNDQVNFHRSLALDLVKAVENNNLQIVELLLKAKADPTIKADPAMPSTVPGAHSLISVPLPSKSALEIAKAKGNQSMLDLFGRYGYSFLNIQ